MREWPKSVLMCLFVGCAGLCCCVAVPAEELPASGGPLAEEAIEQEELPEGFEPAVHKSRTIHDAVSIDYTLVPSVSRYRKTKRGTKLQRVGHHSREYNVIKFEQPMLEFLSYSNPHIPGIIKKNLRAFGFETATPESQDFTLRVKVIRTKVTDDHSRRPAAAIAEMRLQVALLYKDGTKIHSDTSTQTVVAAGGDEGNKDLSGMPLFHIALGRALNRGIGDFLVELDDSVAVADGRIQFYDRDGFDRNGRNRYGMDRDGFYTNGDRYRGELRAGKKNGRGVYIWADGKVYSGEFADDEMDGYGVLEESGGVSYFGYWSGGRRDGPGLEMREGSLEFQRWEKGEEKESSPGGEILSPDYNWVYLSPQVKEGLAHGKGSAISIDGRYVIRNGRFENGHLVQGILIYPDGSVFSGSFRDGWLSNGQIVESDGRVYRGELLRQIPQGAGALSLEDGTRYEGGFDEGLFDGKGTLFYPFGAKYSGTFRNGLLHGNIEFSTEGIKERRRYEMGVLSGGRR